jgi:hypothetical protein
LRKKVLFASNLGNAAVMSGLWASWPNMIGSMEAIIITTSDINSMPGAIPGLVKQPRFFSLRDHLHLSENKLVVSSALSEAVKPPVSGGVTPIHGPFSHDFRHVFLKNDPVPIKLSQKRGHVFKLLWNACGEKVNIHKLMDEIYAPGSGKNMDDVFQKKLESGKAAHKAFIQLVGHEPEFYWLKKEAFEAF